MDSQDPIFSGADGKDCDNGPDRGDNGDDDQDDKNGGDNGDEDDHHGPDKGDGDDDQTIVHGDDDGIECLDTDDIGDNDEWDDDTDLVLLNIDTTLSPGEHHINLMDLIEAIKFKDIITPLHREVNESLVALATDEVGKLEQFCQTQIGQLKEFYNSLSVKERGQRMHNSFYASVKEHQCSNTFKEQCQSLFQCTKLSESNHHIAFRIFEELRKNFIIEKEKEVTATAIEPNARKVDEKMIHSQGKVRYLGGYTLAKRKYKMQCKLRAQHGQKEKTRYGCNKFDTWIH
jgi:hypothetical protein